MGADAAPTLRQWQGHSLCALRTGLTHIFMKRQSKTFPFRCLLMRREAQLGIKRPAFTRGVRGRRKPPHRAGFFAKVRRFYARRASFGMQHPMLPGAWGEQPHKRKPQHESIRVAFSKNHFRRILCPKGHSLGLNALRLRGGAGAARAPAGAFAGMV